MLVYQWKVSKIDKKNIQFGNFRQGTAGSLGDCSKVVEYLCDLGTHISTYQFHQLVIFHFNFLSW